MASARSRPVGSRRRRACRAGSRGRCSGGRRQAGRSAPPGRTAAYGARRGPCTARPSAGPIRSPAAPGYRTPSTSTRWCPRRSTDPAPRAFHPPGAVRTRPRRRCAARPSRAGRARAALAPPAGSRLRSSARSDRWFSRLATQTEALRITRRPFRRIVNAKGRSSTSIRSGPRSRTTCSAPAEIAVPVIRRMLLQTGPGPCSRSPNGHRLCAPYSRNSAYAGQSSAA